MLNMEDIEIIFLELDGQMLYICNGQGDTNNTTLKEDDISG